MLGPSTQLTPARFGDPSLQTDLTLYLWDVVPLTVIARDERSRWLLRFGVHKITRQLRVSSIWLDPRPCRVPMVLPLDKSSGEEGPRNRCSSTIA